MLKLIKTYWVLEAGRELKRAIEVDRAKDHEAETKRRWRITSSKPVGPHFIVTSQEVTLGRGKELTTTIHYRKVDDQGGGCWGCKGDGICSECDRQKGPTECWACQDGKQGVCSSCKGKGIHWTREVRRN